MSRKEGSTVALAASAELRLTGKKFCSHHQGNVPVEAGDYVMRNKVRRWICFSCQSKKRR